MRAGFVRFLAGSLAVAGLSLTSLPALGTASVEAQSQRRLEVGDKAPAISTYEWLKGEEVTTYEPGKVYVLDFWATWCAPCIAAMPHLSELQTEYKDQGLEVIAISVDSVGNSGRLTPELVEKVKAFTADNTDRMGFSVAIDNQGKTDQAVRIAYGMNSIPATFIVDRDGRIAWGGNPTPTFDRVLERVIAGTYDLDAVVKANELARKATQKFRAGDRDEALAMIDEIAKLDPMNHATMVIDKLAILITAGRIEDAVSYAEQIIPLFDDSGVDLVRIASLLTSTENADGVELALKSAEKAVSLTSAEDPRALAILAGVHATKGDFETAVELLRTAAPLAGESSRMRREIDRRLAAYESGELPE